MAKKIETVYSFPKPIDNNELVGHNAFLKTFNSAWENRDKHPIHHAWMLCGARGIGKATLAHNIAKRVYGNIGDFFIIDIDNNLDKSGTVKTTGKQITVHTIRALIENMQKSSMSGGWRVILIDSMDELNTEASNALLKLLEEPPEKTLFLLVVHGLENILPTLRSRARVEKLMPLSNDELRRLCMRFLPDEQIDFETLRLANGSFGMIADLKQSGGDTLFHELINTVNNEKRTVGDLMNIAKKIAPYPESYQIILDAVAHFNRADLYPIAIKKLARVSEVHLKPELTIFEILKCL